MKAAQERYHAAGLWAVERSSTAAQDRLTIAAHQLPAYPTDPVPALPPPPPPLRVRALPRAAAGSSAAVRAWSPLPAGGAAGGRLVFLLG